MKKLIAVLVAIVLGAFLRTGLPPDKVSGHLAQPGDVGMWGKLSARIMNSQVVADWKYSDYVLVKFAKSERLDASLVGYPFCKWRPFEWKKAED